MLKLSPDNSQFLNNDNRNDSFANKGLRDVFLNFTIEIYNRWGALIWQGDNNTSDWDGYANKGMLLDNQNADGTYYVIELNDSEYPIPLAGFLYLSN
jgi:gliding motility-associated-like protein